MELDLSKQSILTLPCCPSLGTMSLLPPSTSKSGKLGKNKLVVGDSTGRVTCFEVRKAEPVQAFSNSALLNSDIGGTGGPQAGEIKNNSMEGGEDVASPMGDGLRKRFGSMLSKSSSELSGPGSSSSGVKGGIRSLSLGGSKGKKDKIFVTNGSKVLGISKKNKTFFTLASNSSAAIEQIIVEGPTIWCRQEQGNFQKYVDGEEGEFHQVGEGVNWLSIDDLGGGGGGEEKGGEAEDPSGGKIDTLLGCQDRCIRVIRDGECISKLGVDVCVTSLGAYDAGKTVEETGGAEGERKVVFGTQSGNVAMLRVDSSGSGRHGWSVPRPGKSSAVNVMSFHDVSQDGVDDVVVGYADGTLAVLGFDTDPDQPQQQFRTNVDESISSIAYGRVSSAEYDEIVCLGYSGKIVSFTNEPLNTRDASDKQGRTHGTVQNENKIRAMQKELGEMKSKIEQTKTQYVSKARAEGGSSVSAEQPVLAVAFDAKTSFDLDEDEAAYVARRGARGSERENSATRKLPEAL
jgi:hypothetical protein